MTKMNTTMMTKMNMKNWKNNGPMDKNEEDHEDTDDEDEYDEDTDDNYEGLEFLQNDVMCSLQYKPGIPASWILLDSQSTVDMFSKKFLSNIRDSKRTLTLYCNTGKAIVTQKGDGKAMDLYGITQKGSQISCPCAMLRINTRLHMTAL